MSQTKIAQFLTTHIPEAEVFAEVVNYMVPFAQILQEIYSFLDRHRSTVLGKSDQFAFRFEDLTDRVPFGLQGFPKTYVDVLRTGSLQYLSFDRKATGRLLVDAPDYFSETNALQNLSHHILVSDLLWLIQEGPGYQEAEKFVQTNEATIRRVVEQVGIIVNVCQSFLFYDHEPDWNYDPGRNRHRKGPEIHHFYYESAEELTKWKKLLADFTAQRIDHRAVSHYARDLDTSLRRINLTYHHELISTWNTYPKRIKAGERGKDSPDMALTRLKSRLPSYVNAFQAAFDLVLPRKEDEHAEYLDRLIEDVILPFWRHRWRLYEVWALVLVMKVPLSMEVTPHLDPRPDAPGAFEWPIPHGNASHPVARARALPITMINRARNRDLKPRVCYLRFTSANSVDLYSSSTQEHNA